MLQAGISRQLNLCPNIYIYIQTAFVSTNSITQGEQVAAIWKPLFEDYGAHIDFAHRTFKWDNRGEDKEGKKKKTDSYMAAVHVVIVGFSVAENTEPKRIFDNGSVKIATNINAYLVDEENIFIDSRSKSICEVPQICKGFQATDNGYLILSEEDKNEMIKADPQCEQFIRQYSMGVEFLHNIPRYCLWLEKIKPNELNSIKPIKKRVQACKEWRENASRTGDAYKLRDIPHLFRPCNLFKDEQYIAVPLVSSSQRKYMPMGFIENGMIPGNNLFCIFGAELYHFGVIMSNVHMAWIRVVGGKLKSDWRYSKDIVYNNFPWPNPTPEQKTKIEQTAQAILDARALYPDCSLADLYDELTMPPELRKAHHANDFAVMDAYGFPKNITENECVAELMKLYRKLTEKK